jgi:hypothetical protein
VLKNRTTGTIIYFQSLTNRDTYANIEQPLQTMQRSTSDTPGEIMEDLGVIHRMAEEYIRSLPGDLPVVVTRVAVWTHPSSETSESDTVTVSYFIDGGAIRNGSFDMGFDSNGRFNGDVEHNGFHFVYKNYAFPFDFRDIFDEPATERCLALLDSIVLSWLGDKTLAELQAMVRTTP